jgi:mRNA interferase MazF
MRRGEIYLVEFGRRYLSNLGKRRPAVIFSAQEYLDVLETVPYPAILVFPLTSRCVEDPENLLRVAVAPRERLERRSEIIVNWCCSVDRSNIRVDLGPLARCDAEELALLETKFLLYCGMETGTID